MIHRARITWSVAVSSTAAVIAATVITVMAELRPELKTLLTNLSGHHWVSKGEISLAVFSGLTSVLLVLPLRPSAAKTRGMIRLLAETAIASSLLLTAFFVWEAMG